MKKRELIDTIKKVLKTDGDFDFLRKLEPDELERLIAAVRDRLEKESA